MESSKQKVARQRAVLTVPIYVRMNLLALRRVILPVSRVSGDEQENASRSNDFAPRRIRDWYSNISWSIRDELFCSRAKQLIILGRANLPRGTRGKHELPYLCDNTSNAILWVECSNNTIQDRG